MAPSKNTRTNVSQKRQNLSFCTKGREGENVEKIVCTPKYITVQELKKPAVVTNRLRRDYDDLKLYDRVSMKAGVRKILTTAHVIQAVNTYWMGNEDGITVLGNSDESSLISTSKIRRLTIDTNF